MKTPAILKQAREHMTNLLKRGNNADLHRMAGELDEKSGDPLAAVKEYQQAVALDPSEENYFAWGSELLLHRAVWQAAEVFRNGVKAHPKSARLLTGLGTALFAGARYDEAARSLCAASDLDPANTSLISLWARSRWRRRLRCPAFSRSWRSLCREIRITRWRTISTPWPYGSSRSTRRTRPRWRR